MFNGKKIALILSAFLLIGLFSGAAQAGIVLRIVGVNPSKDQKQKVLLKAFLPKEIKPTDIVDKGDLEVAYDTQEGAYFVQGEYEVEPGQVVEREVEMEDIWVISDEEISSLQAEASKTAELLKNTDFKERVNFLKNSIDTKLTQIVEAQSVPAINSQKHISDYRDNIKLKTAVEDDLLLLRSLLAKAEALPSVTVWKIFFTVIGFLTFLALTLYFIWHKQVKTIVPLQEREAGGEGELGAKKTEHGEGEVKSEDIEKMVKEEE